MAAASALRWALPCRTGLVSLEKLSASSAARASRRAWNRTAASRLYSAYTPTHRQSGVPEGLAARSSALSSPKATQPFSAQTTCTSCSARLASSSSASSTSSSSEASSSSPSTPSVSPSPSETSSPAPTPPPPSSSEQSHPHREDDPFSSAASEELLQAPGASTSKGLPIGKIERRLSITFTCTVPDCGERSSHEFSRQAYERGIVLCQCPKCETRHLMADHLGWFDSDDLTQGGKYRTVEELLAAKGEHVSRARVLADGTVEVESESDSDK